MKNLIEPEIIARLQSEPIPYEEIDKFLSETKDATVNDVCTAIGISPQRFYGWRSRQKKAEVAKLALPKGDNTLEEMVKPKSSSRRYNRYSGQEKLILIKAYDKGNDAERAELIRKYGLYQSDIKRWTEASEIAAIQALSQRKTRSDKKSEDQIKIEKLEKELQIQEKTTAKMTTLLMLQKKVLGIPEEND
jgi:hypothetical protein